LKDTTADVAAYNEFYEKLGEQYPETKLVHSQRGVATRYWTILNELRPFANRSKKLIDIGCNDGVYCIPYAKIGGVSLGLDISSSLVEKARAKARGLKCRFIQGDIENLNLDEKFDVALFSEVLEHLLKPDSALRKIHSLLLPGGTLLISTPTPLFENLAKRNLAYVKDVFGGKKLLEGQRIDSSMNRLGEFNLGGYSYRHDGYYPRTLISYIESFDFRCKKFYTMQYPTGNVEARTASRFGILDLIPRHIPLIRYFGKTNVGLFTKGD
jgi:2-polyprenyl-3-methyl-5-hydroxy-6-metoxy-1,4-benzoquinol methylase